MTVIAGVIHQGRVWIGADSAASDEDFSLQTRVDDKVFKVGEFLFGFAGSIRARDIARYSFEPTLQTRKQKDHEYLCTTFIDEYRQALIYGGMHFDENVVDPDGAFLLGYRGGLYSVEADFQVGRNRVKFNAHGCGYGYAIGSLDATPHMPPAKRVRRALECAERWSAGVRGPFKVLSI